MALPRRQLPNHHNQRGDDINSDSINDPANWPVVHDDGDYVLVRRSDYDNLAEALDDATYLNDIDIAARVLVDNVLFDDTRVTITLDSSVDSAGDGVSGPADNTLQRLPDTDDGDLWRLFGKFVVRNFPSTGRELWDAVAARYGDR